MQSSLSVDDEVMLTSGVFATVREIADDHVKVEIAEGVVIKVARGAVGTKIEQAWTEGDDAEAETTSRAAPTAPRRTDMARNAAAHAGRTLIVLLIGIAVLFGLVALGGTWKPALGLDLQGGTRITLTANGNPSKENLDEAALHHRPAGQRHRRRRGRGHHAGQQVHRRGDPRATPTTPWSTRSSVRRSCASAPSPARAPPPGPVPRRRRRRPTRARAPAPEPGAGVTLPADARTPTASTSAEPDAQADARPRRTARRSAPTTSTTSQRAAPTDSPSPPSTRASRPPRRPTASPPGLARRRRRPRTPSAPSAKEALAFITAPPQEAIDAYNAYTCPATEPPKRRPDHLAGHLWHRRRRRDEVPAVAGRDRGHGPQGGLGRHPAGRRRLAGQPDPRRRGQEGLRRPLRRHGRHRAAVRGRARRPGHLGPELRRPDPRRQRPDHRQLQPRRPPRAWPPASSSARCRSPSRRRARRSSRSGRRSPATSSRPA